MKKLSSGPPGKRISSPSGPFPQATIKKILVPVDFSAAGKPALRYASYLAEITKAGVLLLHVADCLYYGIELPMLPLEFKKMIQKFKDKLEAIQQAHFKGGKCTFELREGAPSEEITKAAREAGCDLIIMATHGYTGLRHMVMGSTAEKTVRHAACPVLVIKSVRHKRSRRASIL